jgi:hypothetical protein
VRPEDKMATDSQNGDIITLSPAPRARGGQGVLQKLEKEGGYLPFAMTCKQTSEKEGCEGSIGRGRERERERELSSQENCEESE